MVDRASHSTGHACRQPSPASHFMDRNYVDILDAAITLRKCGLQQEKLWLHGEISFN
jgi:hypothetical protein